MLIDVLISEIEKARGPDRDLDEHIFFAAYPDIYQAGHRFGPNAVKRIDGDCPEFTGSLDAAKSLWRETWSAKITYDAGSGHASAVITRPDNSQFVGMGWTMEAAFVIAALKARA